MTGTWINAAAVIIGGFIGLLIHSRLPERHQRIAFQGLGLVTLYIGVSMALKSHNALILILSVLTGALVGETLKLEDWVERGADRVKALFSIRDGRFSEGMVTAFLVYCMGPLTILGAMEEGMGQGMELLLAKSALDAFASVALAATLGMGVLFSVLPLLIYQGGWTFVGVFVASNLSTPVVDEISAVGGILLLGLSLKLLDIKQIRLLNFLPALLFAVGYWYLFQWIGIG
ncbi:DUF554 domain-containing protein [bacterium]|nr:DUF554 domain-containing protein [bacterium]